ncbi:UbiA family prenyltransferase [Fodinibius sp.]|uniref:UbiA family prenyltransferase n=1 Tax=Fodinibius sp. TaxID=1872440 RepID=UPI002ACE81FF|nr:UbiA family prenyltransferase [Fodinibius sp.]MDZ7657841.1 UbiA family prenyltransferase [Fodinibius sp.]
MPDHKNIHITKQLWHFILHLRWHYQLFILSGGFLLGGFLSADLDVQSFLLQFANVHLLLFGGATAYNSFWDKDEGPIGGLQNPPEMQSWMWAASLILQGIGLGIAVAQGFLFSGIYLISIFFFWLYSTPLARWKNHPHKSLVAIGVSTGFNSVLLGYLAAGNSGLDISVWIAAVGVTLMLLSLYPISQIYQVEEDRKRGDHTFALQYGKKGVTQFFISAFLSGLVLVGFAIGMSNFWLAFLFGVMGFIVGIIVFALLKGLSTTSEDYSKVMWIKYGTSMAFVGFLVVALFLKHSRIMEYLG